MDEARRAKLLARKAELEKLKASRSATAPASVQPKPEAEDGGLDFLLNAAGVTKQALGAVQASLNAPMGVGQAAQAGTTPERVSGLEAGLKREEMPQGADPLAYGLGRHGPVAAPGLAAGFMTGGMGFIPAVATQGLMGAGGEAGGQLLSRVLGGNAPDTMEGAARPMLGAAKAAAATEGVVGGGIRMAKAAVPAIGQVFANRSGKLIEKAVEKPSRVPVGKSIEAVEKEGVDALGKFQQAAIDRRKDLGKAVSSGVEGLQKATKGERVINLSSAAKKASAEIEEAATNPVAGELVKSELKEVQTILANISKNPVHDVKTANAARDLIDDAISWKKGTVPKVQSEVGQRALRALRTEIKEQLNAAAKTAGDKNFLKSNDEFHEFAEYYDDVLQPQFGTRSKNPIDQMGRMDKLGSLYRKGGLRSTAIEDMGRFPGGEGPMGDMVNNIIAREFTGLPIGTPSGALKDTVKMGMAPRILGRGIYHGAQATGPVRGSAAAGASMLGSFEPPPKKKKKKGK